MKRFEIIFISIVIFYLGISGIKSIGHDYEELQNDVIRLHILANSDTDEDQALKLRVRDRILEATEGWVSDCKSAEEAEAVFAARIDEINSVAQSFINECGYSYETSSEVVQMEFDNREYGNITMPHGSYKAVRIKIGSAEGHNWWCVMYPPLCVPAAGTQVDIDDFAEYFTDGEINLMKNCHKYTLRLRCAEIYNDLKNRV